MEQKSVLPSANITTASLFQAITYVVVSWLAYRMVLAVYNISPFHPLHRFPGPRIAAASYLYEAYHDWWRVGRYGHEIRRMHERYGKLNSSVPWVLYFDVMQVQSYESTRMNFIARTRTSQMKSMLVQAESATNGSIS